jgi:hypothetical protein
MFAGMMKPKPAAPATPMQSPAPTTARPQRPRRWRAAAGSLRTVSRADFAETAHQGLGYLPQMSRGHHWGSCM